MVWDPEEARLFLQPLVKPGAEIRPDITEKVNGILLFDSMTLREVLIFNCNDGSVVGFSCADPTLVGDLFTDKPKPVSESKKKKKKKKSKYVLQFLYRHETSKFDVMGPH